VNIADLLADLLVNNGVSKIFSVTGGASAEINDAFLRNKKLKLVYFHNEASCSYAAEGYYRTSGKIPVCLVTVGPGATNLITGVFGNWTESMPLLVISGQNFRKHTISDTGLRQFGVQEANIVPIVESFTKFCATILEPNKFNEIFLECWNKMLEPRMGPVWLDMPVDVQKAPWPKNNLTKNTNFLTVKNDSTQPILDNFILNYIEKLKKSEKPLIHIGNGLRSPNSKKLLAELINKLKVPLLLTHNSYDMVETSNPRNFGFPGIFGQRYSNLMVQNCDLYLSLGVRLSLAQIGFDTQNYAKQAEKFQVEIDLREIKKPSLQFDHALCTDASLALEKLLDLMSLKDIKIINSQASLWYENCTILREHFDVLKEQIDSSANYINPYFFIRDLSKYLSSNDFVFTDMGTSYQTTYQAIRLPEGCRLITNTGFAPMGWALPASVGSTYSEDYSRAICLTGDGGLLMSLQDLASIPSNKKFIIFLYNNKGYLTQRQTQEAYYGRFTGVDEFTGLKFPEYSAIAQAFSLDYLRVTNHNQLIEMLPKIFAKKTPSFVDLTMSLAQPQKPRVMSKIDADGNIKIGSLGNMWPYLEETDRNFITNQLGFKCG